MEAKVQRAAFPHPTPLSGAYLPRDWLRLAMKAAIGAKTLRSTFDWLREEVALLDVLAGLPADGGGGS